jgi:hypothetical protein
MPGYWCCYSSFLSKHMPGWWCCYSSFLSIVGTRFIASVIYQDIFQLLSVINEKSNKPGPYNDAIYLCCVGSLSHKQSAYWLHRAESTMSMHYMLATEPPSTRRFEPLINEAASEARNTTAEATSSDVPGRPSSIWGRFWRKKACSASCGVIPCSLA